MTPEQAMQRALTLARRGAGAVSPNPMVGAVLLSADGHVLGEGWHGCYGGPHAEVWAVRDAARRGHNDLSDATMVVTLEPCSHHGKTPPCADLILDQDIPRVVIATLDPFSEVAGRGAERLRTAGVAVTVGTCEPEARRLNAAFLTHVQTGRPLVTLKIALTLDGRLATHSGDSRWVSGPKSRKRVHRWRAEMDAVLVGTGTAAADDPQLTVRHVPLGEGQGQPLRIVLDRTGRLPARLRLFSDEYAARTIAVTSSAAIPEYAETLREAGGRVWHVPERNKHLDLGALLDGLGAGGNLPAGARPVQSLLVEAGPGLATALLDLDLVDRVAAFVAPKILGAGREAIGDLGAERMADALTFADHRWETIGDDALLLGVRREVGG